MTWTRTPVVETLPCCKTGRGRSREVIDGAWDALIGLEAAQAPIHNIVRRRRNEKDPDVITIEIPLPVLLDLLRKVNP